MPYNVHDIRKFKENEGVHSRPYYFFDTNAWLAYLVGSDDLKGNRGEHYADFIEGLIILNNITDPKIIKRYRHQPKIVMSSLLLSEIHNAYSRQISYRQYLDKNKLSDKDSPYKNFRNTDNYLKDIKLLKAKLDAAKDCIVLIDDYFNSIEPFELIENLPITSDFNDFYYYCWIKLIESDYKISVVTDDGDFQYEDIEIITYNHDLRQLSKNNKK